MKRIRIGAVLLTMFVAADAAANCNPPPPGLSFGQWTSLCSREIEYAYSVFGNGTDFNSVFVPSLYQMYVQASQGGGASMPLAGGRCDAPGNLFCNSSGWLLTCNGQIWVTGMQKC